MSRLAAVAAFLCLTACAHAPGLPTIGAALQKAKEGYIAADAVRVKVDAAATLVCAVEPLPPVAAPLCSEAQRALELADAAAAEARRALNVAIDVYTVANEAAK